MADQIAIMPGVTHWPGWLDRAAQEALVAGGPAEELERRFGARAGEVAKSPGFEAFELLRPSDDKDTYLVYTRWASQAGR